MVPIFGPPCMYTTRLCFGEIRAAKLHGVLLAQLLMLCRSMETSTARYIHIVILQNKTQICARIMVSIAGFHSQLVT